MLIDNLNKQLMEGKTVIDLQGHIAPISASPEIEAYGFVKLINFTGQPITVNTPVHIGVGIRMCACASGSAVMKPYPELYKIDNCPN